ncbi:uncharacterized protein LOC109614009 isoform X2 [Musca domestica]|uniref:Uncharacterized protein LOC109614009 isoform X2 n=1 Tax=Musca domestica TaxID=7370 RepID=A0A9J7IFY9_MUSDO|nr:uncharacterized protein LOC109614009 isoform X2 [Musca domestica]
MPLKWPSLPLIVTKAISLILKIWDIKTLYSQFDSHCIAGWEITDKVGSHLQLIMLSVVPDIAFLTCIGVAMFIKTCTFGSDQGTIAYNLVVGILQIWSIFYIYAIEDCGNDAISIVKSVTLPSIIAGIVHLLNSVFCLVFVAPEERAFPLRRPASSTMAENEN